MTELVRGENSPEPTVDPTVATGGRRAVPHVAEVARSSWLATAVSSVGMGFDAYVINLPVIMVTPLALLYGVSPERIAAIQTIFMAGYFLGTLAFSTLSDVLGRRMTLALSIAGYAVAASLTGLAPTLTVFIVARFLTGLLAGGEQPVGTIFALEAWPAKWRGWGTANMFTLYPLGVVLLIVVSILPLPISEGWHVRLAFLVTLPLGFGILWFRHHIIESDAFTKTRAAIEEGDVPAHKNSWAAILRHPELRKRWVGALIVNMGDNFTYHGYSVGLILYLSTVYDLSHTRVLLILLPMYLLQAVACAAGAYFSDIVGRRPVAVTCYIIGIIATIAMLNLPSMGWALVAAGVGQIALLGPGWATKLTVSAEIFPTEVRGAGLAMTLGLGRIAAFAAPASLAALIPVMGMEHVLYIYVGSMALTIIGFAIVPELRRREVYHFVDEVRA